MGKSKARASRASTSAGRCASCPAARRSASRWSASPKRASSTAQSTTISLNSPHEPKQRARRLRQALPRALLQGHGRREAHLDLRDGAEEHREADDRDGPRQGQRQPDPRRRDARHQPQHAAQQDAAAANQGLAPKLVAKIQRALLSVSDKAGVVDFARALAALGIQLLSTGGTAQLLAKEGIA